MATNEIHVNDVGTVFQVTVRDNGTPLDISEMLEASFIFVRPKRIVFHRTPDFVTDGKDGKLQYVTLGATEPDPLIEGDEGLPSDLNVAGIWRLQVHITMPTGSWHTDVISFTVAPIF